MGKKRVIKKAEEAVEAKIRASDTEGEIRATKRISRGFAHIQATYNNTVITITDEKGNTLAWSSAGSIGFSGTKKATPFAAARVAEALADKMKRMGMSDLFIRVTGVGSGRDSAIRAFVNQGFNVISIKDVTPLPHNGPRPQKARRV